MDPSVRQTVQQIHDSSLQASVVLSGAGTNAASWLLGVAGASRTVLELVVPYSESALTDYLHFEPGQFTSRDTTQALARAAYARGIRLAGSSEKVVGVSCTAAIASDRPKRGDHRCHVGIWDSGSWRTLSLTLEKGLRDRAGEDAVVSRLILSAMAESAGVAGVPDLALSDSERVVREEVRYPDALAALLAGHVGSATFRPDGGSNSDSRHVGGVLPGSFDPWHDGHKKLAFAASDILGAPVIYELSITNVDKPRLAEDAMLRRIAQFAGSDTVAVTSAHLFADKAELFPGCTFVIGWDTVSRLVDPAYYDGDHAAMILALDRIQSFGCHFLVAGRLQGSAFKTLDDVQVPKRFVDVFAAVPESAFRADISSTELRPAERAS